MNTTNENNLTNANVEDFTIETPYNPIYSPTYKLSKQIADENLKKLMVNVVNENAVCHKIHENIGVEFLLKEFYIQPRKYADGRNFNAIFLFGELNGELVAYFTISVKVFGVLTVIQDIYGEPSTWENPVNVKIIDISGENFQAFSLLLI
jgi:hypothetical protein